MSWSEEFPKIVNDIEDLLTENRIFKQRNVDIGIVNKDDAFEFKADLPQDIKSLIHLMK
jgi:NADH-quinone oxidoreductase subunit D